MFHLTDVQTLPFVLAGSWVFLVVGVVLLAVRVARLSRLTRPDGLMTEAGLSTALARDLKPIEHRLEQIRTELTEIHAVVERCVQHVGVVRYDAFRDICGRMSFSVTPLDGRQCGIVVSILNGRDGSHAYAKAIHNGRGSSPLSEEEQEAPFQALDRVRVK